MIQKFRQNINLRIIENETRNKLNIYRNPEKFDEAKLKQNVLNDEDLAHLKEYREDPKIQKQLAVMRL